jgi:hypothetical protein
MDYLWFFTVNFYFSQIPGIPRMHDLNGTPDAKAIHRRSTLSSPMDTA